MSAPIICFGQQPCGFFPRRFLFAKVQTARRLQAELGGEISFSTDPRLYQADVAELTAIIGATPAAVT